MADKIPVKAIYTGADVTSLGEFASGDTIDVSYIADGTITAAKLAADTATQAELDTVSGVASAALPKAGGAMTGAITTNSTFDTRDVATDGTKLDTIETNADVTDTLNVTAAGALMDSELAGLAAVKATTGTFLTADQTKLDTIATSANAYVHPNHSGDVVSAADGAMTIQTDAVDIAMLSASGTASSSTFLRGDNAWATAGSTSASDLTSGTLPIDRIADDAITLAKMASGTDGNIISYDASGDPVAIATGTDGQVLTSTGAGSPPAFEDASGGATELSELSDCVEPGNQAYGLGAGAMALAGTNQYYNAAFGYYALRQAGGTNNIAMGWKAGANSYAQDSVLLGSGTGGGGASGSLKTTIAVGKKAGAGISGAGNMNVLMGALNMQQGPCTGEYNCAIGNGAMWTAGDGNYNTAIGGYATMYYLDSGDYNSCIGTNAGNAITTGSNNSCIGHDSDAPSATTSNSFNLGNGNINNLRCNDTSISSLSDERDKAEIEDLPDSEGLAFINKLKPRTFYWDRREWYEDGNPDGSKIKRNSAPWISNAGKRMGFVAQEVQEAIGSSDCMDEIVNTENSDKLEFGLGYLVTPLVKSIQELTSKIEELEAKITTLEEA